jgi:hypothetical protein
MSSTRNINNRAEYNLIKRQNQAMNTYMINNVFSEQKDNVKMFSLGSIPTKVNASNLSYNHIDIESKLRGIRACDHENGNFNPELKLKKTHDIAIFNNNLKNNVQLPQPIVHDKTQRFGFHNV